MRRSLVLNATYEPLGVVSARRAAVLVFADKAEALHDSGEALRSERLALSVPSVIRIRTSVRVPHERRAALSRRAVFLRAGGRCQYCGKRAESIDHVVPRSKGGPHTWENVVAACRRCNTVKRDRLLEETAMRLRRLPHAPRHAGWVVVAGHEVPPDWAPYLGPAGALSA